MIGQKNTKNKKVCDATKSLGGLGVHVTKVRLVNIERSSLSCVPMLMELNCDSRLEFY